MTRDLIIWAVFVAAPVVVAARAIAWWLERPAHPRPRTVADTLEAPSNVVPLRRGPNRKKGAA